MNKFTAVLRRAGLQADKTLVTVESLHQIVAETSVPFSIYPTVFGGLEIGCIIRVYVEDDELRGDVELDAVSPVVAQGQSLAETLMEEPDDTAPDPQPPASS